MILKTPAGLNIGTPVGIPTHNGPEIKGKLQQAAEAPVGIPTHNGTESHSVKLVADEPHSVSEAPPRWGLTLDGKPRGKPGRKTPLEKTLPVEKPPVRHQYVTQSGALGLNPNTHVKVFARPYTEEAVTILVAIMRDGDASPQVRVSAATQVLDRAWGKPKETLEIDAPQEGLRAVLAGVSSSDLSDLLRAMREAASALPVIEGTAKKT